MVRAFVRAFVRVSPSAPVLSALSDSLLGPHSSTHSFTSSPSFLPSHCTAGVHRIVTDPIRITRVRHGLVLAPTRIRRTPARHVRARPATAAPTDPIPRLPVQIIGARGIGESAAGDPG